MKLNTITEMAAKKFCPACGLTMAGHHFWYKGGWRCKKSNRATSDTVATDVPPTSAAPTQAVPVGFADKIAKIAFGTELTLKDGTTVRFLGGGKDATKSDGAEILYPVRVVGGMDAGQLILVRPDEFEM